MANSLRGERVGEGRDQIAQLPGSARPPSAGFGSYQQRSAENPPPIQRRPPSIRIRRLPSTPSIPRINGGPTTDGAPDQQGQPPGRRRATSAPMRPNLPPDLARQATATSHLPALAEESSAPQLHSTAPPLATDGHLAPPAASVGRMRSGSASSRLRRMGSNLSARLAAPLPPPPTAEDEYESEIVDMLDVVGL